MKSRAKRSSRSSRTVSRGAAREPAARQDSNRTVLELKALQSFRTIFGSARTHDSEIRRSAGVSGSQLWALSEIGHSSQMGGITVNGLSARMALHQTTTSNLVNSLVERGLIHRERDAADQRVVHLQATALGKQVLLKTPGPHDGLLVDALRRLEAGQLDQVSESLRWIVNLMRRTAADAAGKTLMGE